MSIIISIGREKSNIFPSLIKEGLGVVILKNHHLAPTKVGALLLNKEEKKENFI